MIVITGWHMEEENIMKGSPSKFERARTIVVHKNIHILEIVLLPHEYEY